MKLEYFSLLSPDPVRIKNIGSIISPTLRQISETGIAAYHYFLSVLLMDPHDFFSGTGNGSQYEPLPESVMQELDIFDLFVSDSSLVNVLRRSLDFFLEERVDYYKEKNCFMVIRDSGHMSDDLQNNIVGFITKDNYHHVCDLICQRNNIKPKSMEHLSKVKNQKALDILKKLQKGRNRQQTNSKSDKNMELGNIISAVANKHPSLNMVNIWDLTVYQLWDAFTRLSHNNIYDIQSMSVAAWGDKGNHFDTTAWFKRLDTNN